MMMRWLFIGFSFFVTLGCTLNTTPAPPPTAPTAALYLAWAQGGDLWAYSPRDALPRRVASGGVIRPLLAPDGQTIAFTRGPAGLPKTLWAVDFYGGNERQLVGSEELPDDEAIGQLAWWDANALYFNTFRIGDAYSGLQARHNLYRVHATTGALALIRPPSEGGSFSFDPQRRYIALVYPGTYDRRDGRISIIDPLVLEAPRNLLFFKGVATGSEALFYPEIYWEASGEAVRFAIPDPDLLYADSAALPTTALWRVPLDVPAQRAIVGSLQADFFGQPSWSPDGRHLAYLRRDATNPNRLDLYLAAGDGADATRYTSDAVGDLNRPRWLDNRRFVYVQGEPGAYWLGAIDAAPQRLAQKPVFSPRWLDSARYVYATPLAEGAALELGTLAAAPQRIVTIEGAQAATLRFAAVWAAD